MLGPECWVLRSALRADLPWRGVERGIPARRVIGVSPRRSRRRSDEPQDLGGGAFSGLERAEAWPDGDWVVRPVTGAAATKTYRCPGCDHEIVPGVAHVVAWPAVGAGPDDRRLAIDRDVNFSRPVLVRQLMVRNGDAGRPIGVPGPRRAASMEPAICRLSCEAQMARLCYTRGRCDACNFKNGASPEEAVERLANRRRKRESSDAT